MFNLICEDVVEDTPLNLHHEIRSTFLQLFRVAAFRDSIYLHTLCVTNVQASVCLTFGLASTRAIWCHSYDANALHPALWFLLPLDTTPFSPERPTGLSSWRVYGCRRMIGSTIVSNGVQSI